jgi:hypothetical protein
VIGSVHTDDCWKLLLLLLLPCVKQVLSLALWQGCTLPFGLAGSWQVLVCCACGSPLVGIVAFGGPGQVYCHSCQLGPV